MCNGRYRLRFSCFWKLSNDFATQCGDDKFNLVADGPKSEILFWDSFWAMLWNQFHSTLQWFWPKCATVRRHSHSLPVGFWAPIFVFSTTLGKFNLVADGPMGNTQIWSVENFTDPRPIESDGSQIISFCRWERSQKTRKKRKWKRKVIKYIRNVIPCLIYTQTLIQRDFWSIPCFPSIPYFFILAKVEISTFSQRFSTFVKVENMRF